MIRHFLAAAATWAALSSAALAQPSLDDFVGEYQLVSSTTAPASTWRYTKGHVSIRKLDERHALILLACNWRDSPKSACDDHYYAQWRDGGLWLQDMSAANARFYFDPVERSLTLISQGYDARATVRRDVYKATAAPLADPVLVRRLRRAESNADSKEMRRLYGHHSKWKYLEDRVELQAVQ